MCESPREADRQVSPRPSRGADPSVCEAALDRERGCSPQTGQQGPLLCEDRNPPRRSPANEKAIYSWGHRGQDSWTPPGCPGGEGSCHLSIPRAPESGDPAEGAQAAVRGRDFSGGPRGCQWRRNGPHASRRGAEDRGDTLCPRGSSGELSPREVLTGEVSAACRQGETPIPGLSAAVPPQEGIGKGRAVGVVWLLSPPETKAVWSLWTQRRTLLPSRLRGPGGGSASGLAGGRFTQ